jgi:Restriction endonuclease
MPNSSDKWRHFERLVAAIHMAADEGAQVRWDDTINGRQFDVTIRFRRGLYDYLTVIECKDYARAVSVEKVEAFITKAADAKADLAVMASASGFQQGAQDVAARHKMTLIQLTESSDVDLSLFNAQWAGETHAMHIKSVEFEYADGERKMLSEQANELTYYANQTMMQCGAERVNLDTLLKVNSGNFLAADMDVYRDNLIRCPPGTRVIGPDDGEIPLKAIACVHVKAGLTKFKLVKSSVRFDPYLLVPAVGVRNLTTGEENKFEQHGLAIGVDTKFETGRFYEQPSLASFYYCDAIEGDIATIYLVESFQTGKLIQAKVTMKVEDAKFYVPTSDKTSIKRLERRLEALKRATKE